MLIYSLSRWGPNDPAFQGFFDLGFLPLPAAQPRRLRTHLETIDPLFIYQEAVGPYIQGSPSPSGTLNSITVASLSAGASQTVNVNVADSAVENYENANATEAEPRVLAPSGLGAGRLDR